MTTIADIAALVTAHVTGDRARFRSTTLMIAANVAGKSQQGAQQLRKLVEAPMVSEFKPLPSAQGLLSAPPELPSLDGLVVSAEIRERIDRVLLEYRQRDVLQVHGLHPTRKLLFAGPPGTGKTMTAGALAQALELPMFRVQLHEVISSHLGETASKLAKVFEHVDQVPAVYLFDEFDSLGAERNSNGDSAGAEMRRVVNSLLQFIEDDRSQSLIVAATNFGHILDGALFRRFDEVITFTAPARDELFALVSQGLSDVDPSGLDLDAIHAPVLRWNLGHADVCAALVHVLKDHVIADAPIDTARVVAALARRARLVAPAEEVAS